MKNFFIAAISMAMVSSAFAQLQPQGTWYLGTANAPEALNIFSDGLNMTPTIGYAISDNVVLTLDLGIAGTTTDEFDLLRPDSTVYNYTITNVISEAYSDTTFSDFVTAGGDTVSIPQVNNYPEVTETVDADSTSYYNTSYNETTETSKVNFAIGLQYFFDDNYFVRGAINSSTHTTTVTNDLGSTETEENSFGWSIGAGKFISVRENWYLTPEVRYTGMSMGDDASEGDLSFRVGLGLRF